MKNLVGEILLNRYHVQEMIGRGGMAEVYRVWDRERSVYLAMKVLYEDMALDMVFLRRFKREAQTLSRLEHPNIVRYYGLEQSGRVAFMLLDYIDGEALKHRIFDAHGPMMLDTVHHVMRAVCGALKYAHAQGYVHADIKPANILFRSNGEVLLTDFGIARMTDAATATMAGAGTPAFMSPEQVRLEDPTPQSDIYSPGIVLYEMLTGGERPFTGEQAETTGPTSEKVRWEQLHLKPASPRMYNPAIPKALEAVVMKCLEKDLDRRWQTPLELLHAFEQAIHSSDMSTYRASVSTVTSPPLPRTPSTPPVPEKPVAPYSRPASAAQNEAWKKYVVPGGVVLLLAIFLAIIVFGGSRDRYEPPAALSYEEPAVVEEAAEIEEPAQDPGVMDTAVAATIAAHQEETERAQPTNTPKPKATDEPTRTPEPTKTPRPTNTPEPKISDAEMAVARYWDYYSDGNTQRSWDMLTSNFKNSWHGGSYDNYVTGWQDANICRVTVLDTSLQSSGSSSADVRYQVKWVSGSSCSTELEFDWIAEMKYVNGDWLLDNNKKVR
ncbi:MAG: protein kinase [Anaerolineaceae bacterium]|nr:protein kinase [Anaerolineaceae bacterium]